MMDADSILEYYNAGYRTEPFDVLKQNGGAFGGNYSFYLMSVVFFFIAAYIAWGCYSKLPRNWRVIYTALAGVFSPVYIVFYAA